MVSYILKRLLLLPVLVLAVSFIIFLFLRLSGTEPALVYLQAANIPQTTESIAMAKQHLGLDLPIWQQYSNWLYDAVRLDFGASFMTGRPVWQDVLYFLPATLKLSSFALMLTLFLSIPLAVWAARYRDKWPDFTIRGLAFIGVSIPNFWLAFMLILLFSVHLSWLPTMGYGGLSHLILPGFAIAFMSLCINARLLRASMLEAQGQRYVKYARMRGISERQVERSHILRNSLLPVVTAIGMHIGELIGGALVIETIFAWPGIGRYVLNAISNKDYPVIQCFTLMMTVIFIVCNLLIDVVYAALDPRIRVEAEL